MAGHSTQSRHPRSRATARGSRPLTATPLRVSTQPTQRPRVISRQSQMSSRSSPRALGAISPLIPLAESSPSPPPLADDVIQAWEMLDKAIEGERDEDPDQVQESVGSMAALVSTPASSSAAAVSAPAPNSEPSQTETSGTHIFSNTSENSFSPPDRKLKRPSRRERQSRISPSASTPASLVPPFISSSSPPPDSSDYSHPTTVRSLLSDIRSGSPTKADAPQFVLTAGASTSRSVSPLGSPTLSALPGSPQCPGSPMSLDGPLSPIFSDGNEQLHQHSPSPPLPLSSKEEIQKMVRDVLRPIYREGRIDKEQYTVVNRRVSRKLYDLVANDAMKLDGSELRDAADFYVSNELRAMI
jgi:hypothetical protein